MITQALAQGADKSMHAALHLVGLHCPGLNYQDLRVWNSTDPAVILLRENYLFLVTARRHIWNLMEIGLAAIND